MKDTDRITNLEDRYMRCMWYTTIAAGTTGTITPPTGGTLVLNQWPGGVSAKASTITAGEVPTGTAPQTSGGVDITVTMSSTGAWALSGTPSAYPIAIIYCYDIKLYKYSRAYTIDTGIGWGLHSRQHSLTSTSDHTSTATAGKMLKADASGLPVDATDTDTDVHDAVGKKHDAGTDTALGAVGTKNPPIDADKALYRDSTASDALVTSTWTEVKAFLKTYFDTLYNKYVHPNHSGDVTSVADGATTIANKQTLAGTAPVAISNTPTVIAGSAPAVSLVNNAGTPGTITAIDTDKTFSANSDLYIPTQKAVKGGIADHAALLSGVHGLAITAGQSLTLTTSLTNQGGAGVLAWPAAGATLTVPTGGGTLGSAAFTAATAYEPANANIQSHITDVTGNVHGAVSANTANMIVRRGTSGEFSCGNIVAFGTITNYGVDGSYPAYSARTCSDTNWHSMFYANYRARGTLASPSAAASGDYVFTFDLWGHDGTTNVRGGQLVGWVTSSVSTGIVPMSWRFLTMDTAGSLAERMRIGHTGCVGINTAGAAAKLAINGGLHVGGDSDPGDNNLLVDGTGTITGAFGCNSKTAQTAYASGGALAAYGTGSYGLDSAANMSALHALVVKIRAALVANGIMS